MNDRSIIAALLFAVTALTGALPAYAGDEDALPPLTPKGQFLVMFSDEARSSSKCIGNPITPLCAVETYLACWNRHDPDLCHIAAPLNGHPAFPDVEPIHPINYASKYLYRVVRREVLADNTFPWPPSPGGHFIADDVVNLKTGDVRIDIVEGSCDAEHTSDDCTGAMSSPYAYILRKWGDTWMLIDQVDPTNPPEAPGNFLSMTQDDATSSSQCIGNPVTPLCAVETHMACWLRPNPNLCRMVGTDRTGVLGGSLAYRVLRQEVLTDQSDLPFRFHRKNMKAGDVRIDVLENWLPGEKEPSSICCQYWDKIPDVYILRHQSDRWVVIFKGPPVDTRMMLK